MQGVNYKYVFRTFQAGIDYFHNDDSSLEIIQGKSLASIYLPFLAMKAIMISFKVIEMNLIALKQNSVKILNNAIMIVVIAKGTQG